MITDPLAIFVLLSLCVLGALLLEKRFTLFRSLGSALVAILLAMVLSNTSLIPGRSLVYDHLSSTGVSLAIALILLSIDYRSILVAGPKMLAAFGLGALGTAVGAMTSAFLLVTEIGPETWKLAGQYTGTYTGGGMNFAALGQAFQTSSDLFSAAVAADVTITAIWLVACLAAPLLFGSQNNATRHPEDVAGGKKTSYTVEQSLRETRRSVKLTDLAALIAVAVTLVGLSEWLGGRIPSIPKVLFLTTLVLLTAQIPLVRRLDGGGLLGNYLLLLFLAANGAQSVIANILQVGPAIFYFAALTVFLHGVVIFGAGRLLRIDAGTLAVASQANVGGAASAVALATARGYSDRVLSGIAVGLMGYAVGNYLGFAVARLAQTLL